MADTEILRAIGRLEGRLEKIESTCDRNHEDMGELRNEMRAGLGKMDDRLRELEVSNAKHGMVAGGVMALAVTFVTMAVKSVMNGGHT